jgi:polyphosphate kinase 2 (PPK2 family)
MGRSFACLLMGAALASCASQSDKELEAVKSARSVLAEWALVEERKAQGRASETYVEQMREQAREQLKTAESGLQGERSAASLIEQVRNAAPKAGDLKRANKALEPLEQSLESA